MEEEWRRVCPWYTLYWGEGSLVTHVFCALACLVPRETGPQGKTRRGSEDPPFSEESSGSACIFIARLSEAKSTRFCSHFMLGNKALWVTWGGVLGEEEE